MTTTDARHLIASTLTKSAFEEHSRLVFFVLRQMGLNECDVAEHSQETFLRYFRHCHEVDTVRRKAWLVTTARHLALDAIAKSQRRKTELSSDGMIEAESTLWNQTSDFDRERTHKAEHLMHTLESSPQARRYDVLKAFYLEGRKVRDIASAKNLRVSSVTSALTRQRARFIKDHDLNAN